MTTFIGGAFATNAGCVVLVRAKAGVYSWSFTPVCKAHGRDRQKAIDESFEAIAVLGRCKLLLCSDEDEVSVPVIPGVNVELVPWSAPAQAAREGYLERRLVELWQSRAFIELRRMLPELAGTVGGICMYASCVLDKAEAN